MTADLTEPRWMRFFSSLRHRNFRLMWTGTLISHTGDWLDHVALSWLVMEQTGSAFYLGLVNVLRGIPILVLTLVGGAMADRMERRFVMMAAQAMAMVLAVVLAVLVLAGNPAIWAIMVIATLRGCVVAFSMPARHSLIPWLVPKEDLPNAVSLNSATMNLTKIFGPLLAGFVIAVWGTGVCFVLNAVSFIGVLGTLAAMRFPAGMVQAGKGENLGASILSGLRFIRSDRIILALVLISVVPTLIGLPYMHLLGVYAHEAIDWGPAGLGILTAAAAAGATVGALAIGGFPRAGRSGRVMLVLLLGAGGALMLFAVNPFDMMAPVLLVAVGALFVAHSAVHATLLQLVVPDEFRGRVLSTLLLNRGLVSVGVGIAAALAAVSNIHVAYTGMGLGIALFALALWFLMPELRRLKV